MYTITRQAQNTPVNNGQNAPNVQVIEVSGANMQNLLAKKYTFTFPVNPFALEYEVALGGFNVFTNAANNLTGYAVDAAGNNLTGLITSPNFTVGATGGLGYLQPSPALVQFANMVANTPHLLAGMRATYDSSFATQQSVYALSYFSTLRNSLRQSVPFTKAFTEAITISRQDYNDQANDFIFDAPILLDGNSFLSYGVAVPTPPAIGGVTIQLALLSAMELANIKSHEQFLSIMRQVNEQCFCN